MRIRAAKLEELTPKTRERALSPRQLAALQREDEILQGARPVEVGR